jgi:uncharacterized protein (DUF433 family)
MSEQAMAAFPVGTRVRERNNLPGSPMRQGVVEAVDQLGTAFVRCDDCYGFWRDMSALERIDTPDPPRAPERVLAPGIVQSDDTCDGKPRLAGTRVRTDSVDGWWRSHTPIAEIASHFSTRPLAIDELQAAIAFEAGRAWQRERRKAKRQRKGDGR